MTQNTALLTTHNYLPIINPLISPHIDWRTCRIGLSPLYFPCYFADCLTTAMRESQSFESTPQAPHNPSSSHTTTVHHRHTHFTIRVIQATTLLTQPPRALSLTFLTSNLFLSCLEVLEDGTSTSSSCGSTSIADILAFTLRLYIYAFTHSSYAFICWKWCRKLCIAYLWHFLP